MQPGLFIHWIFTYTYVSPLSRHICVSPRLSELAALSALWMLYSRSSRLLLESDPPIVLFP
jgi:hypothetical protein